MEIIVLGLKALHLVQIRGTDFITLIFCFQIMFSWGQSCFKVTPIIRIGYIAAQRSLSSTSQLSSYKFVNPPQEELSWREITERAVNTSYFIELIRGMMVVTGKIFKEPATINYPFEKGPISLSRLVYLDRLAAATFQHVC